MPQQEIRELGERAVQDKAQLGMQANLRRQSEVLAQHVEQLRVQLREAELTAAAAMDEEKALHAAQIVALEGDKETLRAELRELSKRMEEEVGRLSREAQEAKQQAWAVSSETKQASLANDWAPRLQLWHARALAAEQEVERLEEAVVQAQKANP